MKNVFKYNLYKGISTVLTFGTPLFTLFTCSEHFIYRPESALSVVGIITILLSLLFLKDKVLEYFKSPSALVLSIVLFVLILILENVLIPMKYVCLATMATAGLDELTFKQLYKRVETLLPEIHKNYKHEGFIFTTSKNLETLQGVKQ